jgi:hypothetical protein
MMINRWRAGSLARPRLGRLIRTPAAADSPAFEKFGDDASSLAPGLGDGISTP